MEFITIIIAGLFVYIYSKSQSTVREKYIDHNRGISKEDAIENIERKRMAERSKMFWEGKKRDHYNGNPDQLERDWYKFMNGKPHPLENYEKTKCRRSKRIFQAC